MSHADVQKRTTQSWRKRSCGNLFTGANGTQAPVYTVWRLNSVDSSSDTSIGNQAQNYRSVLLYHKMQVLKHFSPTRCLYFGCAGKKQSPTPYQGVL